MGKLASLAEIRTQLVQAIKANPACKPSDLETLIESYAAERKLRSVGIGLLAADTSAAIQHLERRNEDPQKVEAYRTILRMLDQIASRRGQEIRPAVKELAAGD